MEKIISSYVIFYKKKPIKGITWNKPLLIDRAVGFEGGRPIRHHCAIKRCVWRSAARWVGGVSENGSIGTREVRIFLDDTFSLSWGAKGLEIFCEIVLCFSQDFCSCCCWTLLWRGMALPTKKIPGRFMRLFYSFFQKEIIFHPFIVIELCCGGRQHCLTRHKKLQEILVKNLVKSQ